jgi:hypothetical protein
MVKTALRVLFSRVTSIASVGILAGSEHVGM